MTLTTEKKQQSFALDVPRQNTLSRLILIMPENAGRKIAEAPALKQKFSDIRLISVDTDFFRQTYCTATEAAQDDTLCYINPNFQRLKDTFDLLREGNGPVMLYPPVAPFPESFERFLKNLRKLKRFVYLCQPCAFHAGLARLKEIVDSGVMGKIQHIGLTRSNETIPPHFRMDINPHSGSNATIFNTFYHEINTVSWLADSLLAKLQIPAEKSDSSKDFSARGNFENGADFAVRIIPKKEDHDSNSPSECSINCEAGSAVFHGPLWHFGPGTQQGIIERRLSRNTPASRALFYAHGIDPAVHEISAAAFTYEHDQVAMWSKREWSLASLQNAYCLRRCL